MLIVLIILLSAVGCKSKNSNSEDVTYQNQNNESIADSSESNRNAPKILNEAKTNVKDDQGTNIPYYNEHISKKDISYPHNTLIKLDDLFIEIGTLSVYESSWTIDFHISYSNFNKNNHDESIREFNYSFFEKYDIVIRNKNTGKEIIEENSTDEYYKKTLLNDIGWAFLSVELEKQILSEDYVLEITPLNTDYGKVLIDFGMKRKGNTYYELGYKFSVDQFDFIKDEHNTHLLLPVNCEKLDIADSVYPDINHSHVVHIKNNRGEDRSEEISFDSDTNSCVQLLTFLMGNDWYDEIKDLKVVFGLSKDSISISNLEKGFKMDVITGNNKNQEAFIIENDIRNYFENPIEGIEVIRDRQSGEQMVSPPFARLIEDPSVLIDIEAKPLDKFQYLVIEEQKVVESTMLDGMDGPNVRPYVQKSDDLHYIDDKLDITFKPLDYYLFEKKDGVYKKIENINPKIEPDGKFVVIKNLVIFMIPDNISISHLIYKNKNLGQNREIIYRGDMYYSVDEDY